MQNQSVIHKIWLVRTSLLKKFNDAQAFKLKEGGYVDSFSIEHWLPGTCCTLLQSTSTYYSMTSIQPPSTLSLSGVATIAPGRRGEQPRPTTDHGYHLRSLGPPPPQPALPLWNPRHNTCHEKYSIIFAFFTIRKHYITCMADN